MTSVKNMKTSRQNQIVSECMLYLYCYESEFYMFEKEAFHSAVFISMITGCDNTMGWPTANSGKHNYPETVMAHAGRDGII